LPAAVPALMVVVINRYHEPVPLGQVRVKFGCAPPRTPRGRVCATAGAARLSS
jgi:hypothetical protein